MKMESPKMRGRCRGAVGSPAPAWNESSERSNALGRRSRRRQLDQVTPRAQVEAPRAIHVARLGGAIARNLEHLGRLAGRGEAVVGARERLDRVPRALGFLEGRLGLVVVLPPE